MHRVPPTNRSVRQKLVDDLKQLNDHVEKLKRETKENIRSCLIYNYDLSKYQEVIDEEREKCRDTLVIDFFDLDNMINSLSLGANQQLD